MCSSVKSIGYSAATQILVLTELYIFHKVRYRSNCLINHSIDCFGKLGKLRIPRFKPITRKNRFLSIPKRSKIMQYRVKMNLQVSFLYGRLFKSATQFLLFLWWDLILLLKYILNSIRSLTFKSHWTDEHSLYLVTLSIVGINCTQHTFFKKIQHTFEQM